MASANAGLWIFGGVIYFFLSFILAFSMVRVGLDYGIDTTGVSSEVVTGGTTSNCYGLTFNSCAEVSETNPEIFGQECNNFKGCFIEGFSFNGTCGGNLLNVCTDFEHNETLCLSAGCSWNTGLEQTLYLDEDRLMDEMTSVNPFRQYSALRSTIRVMTGFKGNTSVPAGFGFIGFFLLTLLPLSMIIFGVYSAIRG